MNDVARQAVLAGMVVVGATVLAVVLAVLSLSDRSPAEEEALRWARCIESAEEFGFDPPGGVEAWCVTTTRSDQ